MSTFYRTHTTDQDKCAMVKVLGPTKLSSGRKHQDCLQHLTHPSWFLASKKTSVGIPAPTVLEDRIFIKLLKLRIFKTLLDQRGCLEVYTVYALLRSFCWHKLLRSYFLYLEFPDIEIVAASSCSFKCMVFATSQPWRWRATPCGSMFWALPSHAGTGRFASS